MQDDISTTWSTIRSELQEACSNAYDSVSKHARKHDRTFLWEIDRSLEAKISAALPQGLTNLVLTEEQVRRAIRENGKMYSQACLAITPKLFSLATCFKALAAGDRTIQEEINCFRSVCERIAVLEVNLQKLDDTLSISRLHTFEELVQLSEILRNSLGTRFNWADLQLFDFSEMPSKTDYAHKPEQSTRDFSASNILGLVDKLQKKDRYKGIRPFYNFCCEFVHPNFGDILSVTSGKTLVRAYGGQFATETILDESPFHANTVNGREFFENQRLFQSAYRFALRMTEEAVKVGDEFGALLDRVKAANRKFAHKNVRSNAHCFHKADFCPCGSGKRISACLTGGGISRR